MHFWLTLLHIAAMSVWFSGLFFLPRLVLAEGREAATQQRARALGRTLFCAVMTPGAVATILLGIALVGQGFRGAWLPAKLLLVALAVLLHVYFGQRLFGAASSPHPSRRMLDRALAWLPLPLLLAIAALAAGKPAVLSLPGG